MTQRKPKNLKRESERGMSLVAILAMMTIFAIALLAVAPSVQLEVQREKELEAIRRGEEVAEAIRQYVAYHRHSKLPSSIDELLEGLPQGTKKRQILRPSAAIDPLSEDGQWRLITPESQAFLNFGKRVQAYNNGVLPSSPPAPNQFWDKYAIKMTVNTGTEDLEEADESEIDTGTSNTPFLGVASQSRAKSAISYYGIENHSRWVFTPMFRGSGIFNASPNQTPPPSNSRDSNRQIP
jgi:type II secretory pathway pseudopilin PulG